MRKKLTIILIIVTVLILGGLFAYLVKTGKIRPLAAGEVATLALDPGTGTYEFGQNFDVNIVLNTNGQNADGVDIFHLHYDPAVLGVLDADSNSGNGVQIRQGSIFPTYTGNFVNTATGEISLSGLDLGGQGYNGTGILATVNFQAISPGSNSRVYFDFSLGSGADCNVAQHGTALDILASVSDGQYTVPGRGIDKPTPPTNLSAQAGTDRINLTWNASNQGSYPVAGYAVYRCEVSGCGPTEPLATTGIDQLIYEDTQASGGIIYYYTVRAFDNQSTSLYSDPSNEVNVQINNSVNPPSAPQNLTAQAGADRITLSWTASTEGTNPIAGYAVYRGEVSGQESTDPTGTPTGTTFEDTTASAGITYYYIIKAYDNQSPPNYSEASNEISSLISPAITPPSVPTNLSAQSDMEKIGLTWTASTEGTNPIAGYKIYRGGTAGGELEYGTSVDTIFVDTQVSRGIVYYYVVRAYDNQETANYSNISNEINIKLKDLPPPGEGGGGLGLHNNDDTIIYSLEERPSQFAMGPETPGVSAEEQGTTEETKEKAAPPAQTISKLPSNLQPQKPTTEPTQKYEGKTIQTWALWFLYAIIPALLAGGAVYLYLRKKKKDNDRRV